jgi:thymidylate synthase
MSGELDQREGGTSDCDDKKSARHKSLMHIVADTLDDLMRDVLSRLLERRGWINPSKGENTEIVGAYLQLTFPRSRLSRTELKGTVFSCLGEFIWYMAASNRLDFIQHYIKAYPKFSDDKVTLHGAYGPRLFKRLNQIETITQLLRDKPSSRQAVIQLFDAKDLARPHKDVPCTCVLQFLVRGGRLQLLTYMRSNDAFLGLPHDVFAFTMIQELVARSLGIPLGAYRHIAGSLHLYKRDRAKAQAFLQEGWQASVKMPPMPSGDQWSAIKKLVALEQLIRTQDVADIDSAGLAPYWRDLAYLLQVYKQFTNRDIQAMAATKQRLSSQIFNSYVEARRGQD